MTAIRRHIDRVLESDRHSSLRYSSLRWKSPRGGSVLLIVLVSVVLMALAAYAFTSMMLIEDEASRLVARQVQARYLVDSGVDYTRLYLTNDYATRAAKGGLWDNANYFQAVVVGVDPADPQLIGRFTVISSNLDDEGNPEGFRYGLMDESNKLNLNILTFVDNQLAGTARDLLMALPQMTEDVADAILDWIDADDETRDYGCELGYYQGLSPPYQAKNGPLDSVDELLLVRGVTPQLLFGLDTNRNGILDNEEMGGDVSGLEADALLGWANYLTLYSKESNLNNEGLVRVNLNNPDLEQLYTDLRAHFNEEWTRFIIQYRIKGPYTLEEDDPDPVPATQFLTLDLTQEAAFTFSQVLDLVDAYTTADNPDDADQPLILRSPISTLNMSSTFPILMAHATTFAGDSIPGRLNLMQAPRRLLEGIPGMTEDVVDEIITRREFELDDPYGLDINRQYETWILVEGLVDLATMRTMMPLVCVGGDVYSAEIVGYYDDGVGTSRAEAVLDTTLPIPGILFWRDKTHIQGGYSVDILGVDLVR